MKNAKLRLKKFSEAQTGWKKVKVLVTQLCPTLWDPLDCSPPGFSVHEIL